MKHKWHKEIKAWADGAEIEWCYMAEPFGIWQTVISPNWDSTNLEYRIKPQPKEPQYLYVYKMMTNAGLQIQLWDSKTYNNESYIGKIKLEQDDE